VFTLGYARVQTGAHDNTHRIAHLKGIPTSKVSPHTPVRLSQLNPRALKATKLSKPLGGKSSHVRDLSPPHLCPPCLSPPHLSAPCLRSHAVCQRSLLTRSRSLLTLSRSLLTLSRSLLYVSGLMRVMRVSCLKRDRQLRRAKPKTLNPKPSTLNPRGCAAYGEMWQEM